MFLSWKWKHFGPTPGLLSTFIELTTVISLVWMFPDVFIPTDIPLESVILLCEFLEERSSRKCITLQLAVFT